MLLQLNICYYPWHFPFGSFNPFSLPPSLAPGLSGSFAHQETTSMAFSSWFFRLRYCSKISFNNLHASFFRNFKAPAGVLESENARRSFGWSSYLLPIAIAVSSGSFAFHFQNQTSLCDSSNTDSRSRLCHVFSCLLFCLC